MIGVASLLFIGWPILIEAFRNILDRRMTMELSMTIAIIAAAGISEFFTALVVTLFVLIAEELEHLTIARGRRAIRELVEFVPREARVRRDGRIAMVAVDVVVPGETVLVNPGEKVPVDGELTEGKGNVDESMVTGEPMPVAKATGSKVTAGTLNQTGGFVMRAEKVGADTLLSQIVHMVAAAQPSRAEPCGLDGQKGTSHTLCPLCLCGAAFNISRVSGARAAGSRTRRRR